MLKNVHLPKSIVDFRLFFSLPRTTSLSFWKYFREFNDFFLFCKNEFKRRRKGFNTKENSKDNFL